MREPLSQHVLGRLVACFLLGMSVLIVVLLGLSMTFDRLTPDDIRGPLLLATLAQTTLAGVAWWLLPWERWSRRAALWVLPVGGAAAATMAAAVPSVALVMALFHLVLVAFVGLSQEPGWPAAFSPLAGAAYVLPLMLMGRWEFGVLAVATVVTSTVCLLGGEVLAWMASQLRRAHALELGRQADMQELLGASTRLSSQIDVAEAADLVAKLAANLLHADAAAVLLPDAAGILSGAGAWCWHEDVAALRLDPAREPRLVEAVRAGRPTALGEWGASASSNGDATWPGSTLLLPLRGTKGPVGAVAVVSTGRMAEFDRFTETMGQTFATQAGLAFERVWATESLRAKALRDELTGLGNRRHAAAMLAGLEPGDAVVMLDFDHFKLVNDELGHATGDAVLCALGDYLRATLRESDMVARYGGEEFLVVLTQAGARAATTMERLLSGWRATIPLATLSGGVAMHAVGASPTETLARADAALYQAKEAGRDRWRFFGEAVQGAQP